jgi:hypothetical protein
MFSKLKAALGWLAGGSSGTAEESAAEAVEYKGYRIRAAPQSEKGQYRTAGTIEKDMPDGMKEHRFVRADVFATRDDALSFSISKAKQLIDQQGDRIFS